VRYVVVVAALAPDIENGQQPQAFPVPADLVPALVRQDDLRQVPAPAGGFSVFENMSSIPERAERSGGAVTPSAAPSATRAAGLSGWGPVLPGPVGADRYTGPLGTGTVFASYAPASRWQLVVGGKVASESAAFGWAAQYPVTAGQGTLQFRGSPLIPWGVLLEVLVWLATAAALLGRRRWLWWWWRPLRRRVGRSAATAPGAPA